MSSPPHVQIVPNTPLSNRYSESYSNSNGNNRPPIGPCNYTNLNIGGSPRCGCVRFTDRSQEHPYLDAAPVRPGVCVCEHHSCFHSHDPVDGHRSASAVSMTGEGISLTQKQSALAQAQAHPREAHMREELEVGRPSREESLPDTVRWNQFVKTGSSLGSLPAIPSQCLLPSENGSGASSYQTGYARPFGGRGLNTLGHIPRQPLGGHTSLPSGNGRVIGENGQVMKVYEDHNGYTHLQSITEADTPSIQSMQDIEGAAQSKNGRNSKNVSQVRGDNEPKSVDVTMTVRHRDNAADEKQSVALRGASNEEDLLPKIRSIIKDVADYPLTKRNHEHRLDQLENASFSNAPLEALREDHEFLDTRVMELEGRMDAVEKQQMCVDNNSSFSSHQPINASVDSRTSSALIASAIDQLDYSRIEALESHIAELQASAPPSYSRPWEVEVVFLPFGPHLTGIWSSQPSTIQGSRTNSGSGDEWTQTQQHNSMAAAQARLTSHDHSVDWEASASDVQGHHTHWLMSKACGLHSLVDERLRSRGLVRTVQIRGPDARDVQAAMLSAFGDMPHLLAADPYSQTDHRATIPHELRQHLALQHPWIPLRKLHKNSCLRFLNTSEMVSPALWTVQFLSSSVAMRSSGIRRLYVTQADSYIQHLGPTVSWTWQKLRQLDRVYPDASVTHTPEGDAHEPCWEYDERFDTPPSMHSSMTSHHSHSLSIRPLALEQEPTSPSDHFSSAGISPAASTTPTSVLACPPPLSPTRNRHPFRPPNARNFSLPLITAEPVKSSPSQAPKRRNPSLDPDIPSSPSKPLSKRHRTRSPSRPKDTPRWSVGPPSPYAFAGEDFKRGMTPFAYATPHSNAPYVERRLSSEMMGGDGDEKTSTTDESEGAGGENRALSDFEAGGEWEGLEEDDGYGRALQEDLVAGDQEMREIDEESDGCPSEYPSRQPEKVLAKTRVGFTIHVDEEN